MLEDGATASADAMQVRETSLDRCILANPDDQAASRGPGPALLGR